MLHRIPTGTARCRRRTGQPPAMTPTQGVGHDCHRSDTRPGAHLAQPEQADHHPWWPLATSMLAEHDYQARLEGTLPAQLVGPCIATGRAASTEAGSARTTCSMATA